jgi:hypothetical protein
MNTLGRGLSVGLSVLASLLVGGVVYALPLEASQRTPALAGVAVALIVGLVALALKLMVAGREVTTTGVKLLLGVQVGSFFLRLMAVGVGVAMLARGPSSDAPLAFVLGFFAVYMLQQVVEVASLLTHRSSSVKSEVISR